jgi:hypothetical protein
MSDATASAGKLKKTAGSQAALENGVHAVSDCRQTGFGTSPWSLFYHLKLCETEF